MRSRFFDSLLAAAIEDPDIVLITGDLGFGSIWGMIDPLPKRDRQPEQVLG
jgi:hypothetical protein